MPESFGEFFANHPFWAVFLIIFMGLPIIGAVAWIILNAFKKDPQNPPD
jgi:hypothetical protein